MSLIWRIQSILFITETFKIQIHQLILKANLNSNFFNKNQLMATIIIIIIIISCHIVRNPILFRVVNNLNLFL